MKELTSQHDSYDDHDCEGCPTTAECYINKPGEMQVTWLCPDCAESAHQNELSALVDQLGGTDEEFEDASIDISINSESELIGFTMFITIDGLEMDMSIPIEKLTGERE